jgi:hypothetical protein
LHFVAIFPADEEYSLPGNEAMREEEGEESSHSNGEEEEEEEEEEVEEELISGEEEETSPFQETLDSMIAPLPLTLLSEDIQSFRTDYDGDSLYAISVDAWNLLEVFATPKSTCSFHSVIRRYTATSGSRFALQVWKSGINMRVGGRVLEQV